MTSPITRKIFSGYRDRYLILDAGCLYVASTLREEIWLYREKEDPALLDTVRREADRFHIRNLDPDRPLFTFSGGEQALIASLLILTVIESLKLKPVNLLLSGILESLSPENLRMLTERLRVSAEQSWINPHILRGNRLHPL